LDKEACELVFYKSACNPDQKESTWTARAQQGPMRNPVAA
jgi:hypothetical protein